MSMQDPLSDLLTRVRNGQMAKKVDVSMPSSKAKVAVAEVLKSEGYITGFSVDANAGKPLLTIELKYHEGAAVIEEIKRVSRPGLRSYVGVQDIPTVRNGLGISIVSTSKGVMSDRQAKADGIGGEVLCTVF